MQASSEVPPSVVEDITHKVLGGIEEDISGVPDLVDERLRRVAGDVKNLSGCLVNCGADIAILQNVVNLISKLVSTSCC